MYRRQIGCSAKRSKRSWHFQDPIWSSLLVSMIRRWRLQQRIWNICMARLMIKLSSKSASSGIFCFRKICVKKKNMKTRNQRKSKRTSLWKKSTYMWKTTVHHRNGPVSLILYLGRLLESAWLVVLINIGTTVVATETAFQRQLFCYA